MQYLPRLFANNRRWAEKMITQDPSFFSRLASIQSPEYLWIGCSDSRVPANQITGLDPGEVFVHRNIANIVVENDLNCLSVLQFAVDVLGVKHVIVCGHYGCGGVKLALEDESHGIVDRWLAGIRNIRKHHDDHLIALPTHELRWDRLCELNVISQVQNVCNSSIVTDAWNRGQNLTIHGWIYGLKDGLLRDLEVSLTGNDQIQSVLASAVKKLVNADRAS